MIDYDLIEKLDPAELELAKAGLRQLASSGLLTLQKERLKERVLTGPMEEDVEVTSKKIQDYRRKLTSILSLEELIQTITT